MRQYRVAGNSKHGRKKELINQPENNYEIEFLEIKKRVNENNIRHGKLNTDSQVRDTSVKNNYIDQGIYEHNEKSLHVWLRKM